MNWGDYSQSLFQATAYHLDESLFSEIQPLMSSYEISDFCRTPTVKTFGKLFSNSTLLVLQATTGSHAIFTRFVGISSNMMLLRLSRISLKGDIFLVILQTLRSCWFQKSTKLVLSVSTSQSVFATSLAKLFQRLWLIDWVCFYRIWFPRNKRALWGVEIPSLILL